MKCRFLFCNFADAINWLLSTGKKNKLRVYYLSWLRNKIIRGEEVSFVFFSWMS